MFEDKRRAPRHRHDSVLEIYDQSGRLIVGVGKLVDFSMVGACFFTTKRLADGERINARLRLLQEGVLDISAHVVWSRKQANAVFYGIEFDLVKKARR
ncbi:MAG: PilZ domain-containing protein [Elusimicrobia bacterium]|nr:PilZ domain-containing protein [Elusimicrobiota bacterium]